MKCLWAGIIQMDTQNPVSFCHWEGKIVAKIRKAYKTISDVLYLN